MFRVYDANRGEGVNLRDERLFIYYFFMTPVDPVE